VRGAVVPHELKADKPPSTHKQAIALMLTLWPTLRIMAIILLEALGALLVFVLIIYWTMFSGRDKGELKPPSDKDDKHHQ
jgi:hypothetical protein